MNKLIAVEDVVKLIKNNSTIVSSGFRWSGSPELILSELGLLYRNNNSPKNLNLIFSSAQGDSITNGLENLAQEGLLRRVIGGFWGISPKLYELAKNNKLEAYNLPQGVLTRIFSSIASNSPGFITKTGLGTYIDPRNGGGRLNDITKKDIIKIISIENNEYLLYKNFNLDFGFLRGTYADENGNISLEDEAVTLELLSIAMAVHNCGGKVIIQVKDVVNNGKIKPKNVAVPGYLIDYVVIAKNIKEYHRQSCGEIYDPSLAGNEIRRKIFMEASDILPRKIIAQRAIKELKSGDIINLGQGIPTDIIPLLKTEKSLTNINYTLESGVSGGTPHSIPDFGISYNPESMIRPDDMFNFFSGGGLDVSFLGFAEIDSEGNINVSKLAEKFVGCGGFIDIAQNTKKIIFCGTFTTKGLVISKINNKINIVKEGSILKFKNQLSQITYNPNYSKNSQIIKIITERCVFEIIDGKICLSEIYPGIDIKNQILSLIDFKINVNSKLGSMLT